MDRRTFLFRAAATAAMTASPFAWSIRGQPTRSSASTWRIPAEFEPTRAVWLGYGDDAEFSAVTTRIAKALLPHAEIVIVAKNEKELANARTATQKAGLDEKRITFLHSQAARFFIRDYNVFAAGSDGLGVVDFRFESYGLPGWCANHLYPEEPERAKRCAGFVDAAAGKLEPWIAEHRKARLFPSQLFLEGGAIEVNGKGTLLVSQPLMLQRNAGQDRQSIERQLLQLPGITNVVWLAEGVAEDPHMMSTITGDFVGFGAGSHTDEFVRFADPGTILLAWIEPNGAELHPVDKITLERMTRNLRILSEAKDQDGRPFKIVKVPMPRLIARPVVLQEKAEDWSTWTAGVFPAKEGRKVGDQLTHVAASSYLNYVVANGIVLLPDYTGYGTPKAEQDRVGAIFEAAFPGREIKFIDVTHLNWAGGGIHCATCNEPKVS